jgi:peptidoglycan hydrolase-like protein with peptidoglycan-binding domain
MLTFLPTRRRIGAGALALCASLSGTGVALAPAAHADTVVPASGQPYTITLQMSECGVMYLGTTGTCIVSLQTWMNWALGTNLTIDGVYGPATLAAVEEFQLTYQNAYPDLGIPTDGQFEDKSRWALVQWYLSASNDGQQPPCQMNTGMYCDPGAVEPGLQAGVVGTAICTATGLVAGAAAAGSGILAPVAEPVDAAAAASCETIMD